MEMCCFDSEENSSEEEEDDEDSSILTTVKTSSKADNNKIIMGINDFNNSSEEEESSILETEDKDVMVLSSGLLNQEEGLNGNGELFIRRQKLKYSSVSDQWIKSQLLVLHQSYSFLDLSGAYGLPSSSSLRFLPDFLNLRFSSNGFLLEPAVALTFEPSVLNKSANYQLICALPSSGLQIVCFELYSSETKIWSESNTIYLELGDDTEFTGNGFYMKGMAYWQTRVKDMKNESYQMISLPSQMNDELCNIGLSSEYNAYWFKIYCGMDLEYLKLSSNLLLKSPPEKYRALTWTDEGFLMSLVGSSPDSCRLIY